MAKRGQPAIMSRAPGVVSRSGASLAEKTMLIDVQVNAVDDAGSGLRRDRRVRFRQPGGDAFKAWRLRHWQPWRSL